MFLEYAVHGTIGHARKTMHVVGEGRSDMSVL